VSLRPSWIIVKIILKSYVVCTSVYFFLCCVSVVGAMYEYFGFVWKSTLTSRHSIRNQKTITQDPLCSHENIRITCRNFVEIQPELV
jgi:hypothetical protein